MKVHHDTAPALGRAQHSASIQVAVLGLCGRGENARQALAELLLIARGYQARIDAAIEVIEAEIKANEP